MPNDLEPTQEGVTQVKETPRVEKLKQNRLKVFCEIEGYEGYIIIPEQLGGRAFHELWKALQDGDEPEGHWIFFSWRMVYPLVLEWHLEGITKKHLEPTGMEFPNMEVMSWVINACNHLLETALTLGNLR